MKKIVLLLFFTIFTLKIYADNTVSTDFSPITYCEDKDYKVGLVNVKFDDYLIAVTIEKVPKKNLKELRFFTGAHCYVLFGKEKHPIIGILDPATNSFKRAWISDNWGVADAKKGVPYRYTLVFSGRPLSGETDFSLIDDDPTSHGPNFLHYKVANPLKPGGNPKVSDVEAEAKQRTDIATDPYIGIYVSYNNDGTRVFVNKHNDGNYSVRFISDNANSSWWHPTDYVAVMRPTAVQGTMLGEWVAKNKLVDNNCKFFLDGVSFRCQRPYTNETYIRVYPSNTTSAIPSPSYGASAKEWSGTGWSLLDNYIVTNYHVVDGAKTIQVNGIGGDNSRSCSATVVATDKNNDLAILRLNGVSITNIPYAVTSDLADVGEEIFVLGYPMTQTMGEEIKLTNGIISSLSGFEGDMANYQISAPIQPGNSGGPMFDHNGNVIGIVVAKHEGAELVSYAIKTSYLQNLMLSALNKNIFPRNNTISNLPLTGKVKDARKYVYFIKCSDTANHKF